MTNKHKKAKEKILKVAKTEFLNHGYKDASLRNIVKEAGVTTGAFYFHFDNKEELFNVLVKDTADGFISMYMQNIKEFDQTPHQEIINLMIQDIDDYTNPTVDYMYTHYEEFKLLITCAEGTKYEDYIDSIIDLEVEFLIPILSEASKHNANLLDMDENTIHIIMSAYFNGILEVVRHDMNREAADKYLFRLSKFYRSGWRSFLTE